MLGIDSNSYGYHWYATRKFAVDDLWLQWGFFQGTGDALARRAQAFKAARKLFMQLPDGSHVFIEEALVLAKNIETTRKLVMMVGVLEAAFMFTNPDATWWSVDVSTWRRQVLNPPRGQSPKNKEGWKELARQHVLLHGSMFPLTVEGCKAFDLEPDLYDAACVAHYGAQVVAGV